MVVPEYMVGIDVGGTFTDLVAIDDGGAVLRAKALTTPEDRSRGVLDAIDALCATHGLERDSFMGRIRMLLNGTTTATNAVTELRGAKVGLITTRGFEDVLRIARSARWNTSDNHLQTALPELVRDGWTVGVTERVDYTGRVVVGLDEAEAEEAVRHLVEDCGVEAIAVCLLWSFKHPAHEARIKELISARFPGVRVALSHLVAPVMREYERTVTTVIDAFIGDEVSSYVGAVEKRLTEAGLRGPLRLMHSMGGCLNPAEAIANPTELILSGPTGGVAGAMDFGRRAGLPNLITCDVGGTTFDTALIHGGTYRTASRVQLKAGDHPGPGFLTSLSMVEISSIGAGGGSIAWIDMRGMLRVGPQSAGANPGPVCYGRGGTEPTLTDACVVLGIIDAGFYLGGTMQIDAEAARRAVTERLAEPLGLTPEDAAAGVYELAVTAMAGSVRAVSVQKGYEPREFAALCYGGAGGMIVPEVCRECQIPELVIPDNAAVFSAYGLLTSDFKRDYVTGVGWRSTHDVGVLTTAFDGMAKSALRDLGAAGFAADEVTLAYFADVRFVGQFFELTVPIADPHADDLVDQIARDFGVRYEHDYGSGTAWVGAEHEVLSCRLSAKAGLPRFETTGESPAADNEDTTVAPKDRRSVHLPGVRRTADVAVFDREALRPGARLTGPALVEGADTTVLLPPAATLEVDAWRGLRIRFDTDGRDL